MLNYRLFRLQRFRTYCLHSKQLLRSGSDQKQRELECKTEKRTAFTELGGSFKDKYTIFKDNESPEIFDVEEERRRYQHKDKIEICNEDQYAGLNLNRGLYGVFDIADLIDVLRKESAEDIVVCTVPKDLKYVDYLVVCSGRSYRHMLAIAEFVKRMFKIKRHQSDAIVRIEGEKSRDWMAMDLGNIALHIFSPNARENYDLESLWSIGMKYDSQCNKPQDPLVELFEKHSIILNESKSK